MALITIKKVEQGICPYCGGTDIDYSSAEFEDDMMIKYPAQCNECGRSFDEWYKLTFTGHNVGDSLDVILDVGDEGKVIEMED